MNEKMLSCNMRGKMESFDSISTSCSTNDICQARISKAIEEIKNYSDDACAIIERYLLPSSDKRHLTATKVVAMLTEINCPVCICIFCYADKMQKYQTGTRDKLTRNAEFLSVDRDESELPVVNPNEMNGLKPFRYEALGDLGNVAQARNYIRMMKKNKNADHALWTKNPNILWNAVKKMGKPKNTQFILSSAYVNVPDIEQYEKYNKLCRDTFGYNLFDKLFTVWTADEAKKNNVTFNCCGSDGMKDRKCKNCLNCYKRSDFNEYVNELLR